MTPRQSRLKTVSGLRTKIQGGLEVSTFIPDSINADGTITANINGSNRQVRDISRNLLAKDAPIAAVINPKGLGFYVG